MPHVENGNEESITPLDLINNTFEYMNYGRSGGETNDPICIYYHVMMDHGISKTMLLFQNHFQPAYVTTPVTNLGCTLL